MARTIAEKERVAAEIADRLAHQAEEPSWRDAEPLRRIADAFRRSVAIDAEVAEAVRSARDDGHSWARMSRLAWNFGSDPDGSESSIHLLAPS